MSHVNLWVWQSVSNNDDGNNDDNYDVGDDDDDDDDHGDTQNVHAATQFAFWR